MLVEVQHERTQFGDGGILCDSSFDLIEQSINEEESMGIDFGDLLVYLRESLLECLDVLDGLVVLAFQQTLLLFLLEIASLPQPH